jgi:cytosine/adenosine deaminase-related metal-dependent hydrolase
MSELDDFTAQLNAGDEDAQEIQQQHQHPGGPPPGAPQMSPEQMAAAKAAAEMKAKIDARPLQLEKLKGKVDLKWFGHAGFKIQFLDE